MTRSTRTPVAPSDGKLKTMIRQIAHEVVRDELAKALKTKRVRARAQRAKRDERLRRHFGAVDLGHATGADNAAIDADLARAYGASHIAVR